MRRAWMPMYWGDYKSDTAHLSTLEHGAYLLLIAHYWQTGSLPNDDERLARIAGLDVQTWLCVRIAIASFFTKNWTHNRIEKELKNASEKSEKASQSASKRWNKKEKSIMRTQCEGNAKAYANGMLSQSQSYILSSNEDNKRAPSALEIFREVLSEETAKDLIAHRQAKKAKLTPRAAKELVRAFKAYGNPEEAAAEMMLRGWTGFKSEWMENSARAGPSSNGKGGMASLLAKSLGLKNGRESANTSQNVHGFPIDNGAQRGNLSDDGGELSGNIIDISPRYVG